MSETLLDQIGDEQINVVSNFIEKITKYPQYFTKISNNIDPIQRKPFEVYLCQAKSTLDSQEFGETDVHIFSSLSTIITEKENEFLENFQQELSKCRNQNDKLLLILQYWKNSPIELTSSEIKEVSQKIHYIVESLDQFVKDRASDIFQKEFHGQDSYSKFILAIPAVKRLVSQKDTIDLDINYRDLVLAIESFNCINLVNVQYMIKLASRYYSANERAMDVKAKVRAEYQAKWYIDEKLLDISVDFAYEYIVAYQLSVQKTDHYLEFSMPNIDDNSDIYKTKSLKLSYYVDRLVRHGFLDFSEISFLHCIINNPAEKANLFRLIAFRSHYSYDNDDPFFYEKKFSKALELEKIDTTHFNKKYLYFLLKSTEK